MDGPRLPFDRDPRDRWREHPVDVLGFVQARQSVERVALVVVSDTTGGALRAPGALAAVTESGQMAGYVSNGCVDADLVLHAQAALTQGAPRTIRYGSGSPWPDIRLPCGGAVTLEIVPDPHREVVSATLERLAGRKAAQLWVGQDGLLPGPTTGVLRFTLTPRPRLRLAGRGAALAAVARVGLAAEFEVSAASPDADDLRALAALGVAQTTVLDVPSSVPDVADDAWTAVVLLFHDHDWEPALLMQALDGPAAFIGALGSHRTHAARIERLRATGADARGLARIHGPLGLVGSLRDANLIAVSAMAQIVEEMRAQQDAAGRNAA